jgi:hypothetical protein
MYFRCSGGYNNNNNNIEGFGNCHVEIENSLITIAFIMEVIK